MNDPLWDLGDLSVEAGFGPEQDLTVMEAYCGGCAPPVLYSRLELYKAMSDQRRSLWSLVSSMRTAILQTTFSLTHRGASSAAKPG